MADKLDRQPVRILQTSNTLGIDDLSTQPSSVDNRVDAKLPIEFGRYRLVKQLGEGGMGVVYLAHDIELDRKVALKLPHLSGTTAKAFAERFRREARLAATLDHRNICRIYDIGEYQDRQFLTMKFVEGKSLHEIIRSKGAIDPRTAVALLQRIAQAVHFAHERGVIHRDLKPANIMVKKNRDFVIMDFGLARRADQEEAQLTATGAILGTPAYMAPEQLRGEKGTNGAQSDVYSLGIILYELLTGQRPFQGTAPQIYAQVLISDSVSPASVRDGIEPALDAICQKATHKEVGQRYRSAEEFASVLGQFLNTSIVNGPAPETAHSQQPKLECTPKSLASLPPRGRTSKMLIALGGAAFAFFALATIIILVRNKDGTTTELRLPDGALAVEVQKDNRTLATVNVADNTQPAATQPSEETSDQSQIAVENLPDTVVLSEVQAIRLLHPNWSLYFEGADGSQSIINPLETIADIPGKVVAIRADEKQEFTSTYVSEVFVPCIAALPGLTRIDGTGQFSYSEPEFLALARTPFATNGTILSGSWTPLTAKVADSLVNNFYMVESVSLLIDCASDIELRSIASQKKLRSVWFNCLGGSVGPEGVEAIASMSLDFMGLYSARKFNQAELISLGNSTTPHLFLWSCDFDNSDFAIFAKHSLAESFTLIDTKVSDEGVLQLQYMKNLKQVDLGDTRSDISTIQTLAKLKPDLTVNWSGGTVKGSEVPTVE